VKGTYEPRRKFLLGFSSPFQSQILLVGTVAPVFLIEQIKTPAQNFYSAKEIETCHSD
jgi:hypothetical protein